jgi:hypothetical protein
MYANKRDSYPGFPNYYLAILASATARSRLLSASIINQKCGKASLGAIWWGTKLRPGQENHATILDSQGGKGSALWARHSTQIR